MNTMNKCIRAGLWLALIFSSALLLVACEDEVEPYADVPAPQSSSSDLARETPPSPSLSPAQVRIPEQLPESKRQLEQLAGLAYNSGQHEDFLRVMQKLHGIEPLNPQYNYQLVIAHALLDNKTPAYNTMLIMQRQGMTFDFNQNPDSENIRHTELYEFVNNLMQQASEGTGSSEVFATLPGDFLLAEAVAWDAENQRLLVGSVHDGRILSIAENGSIDTFATPGDWWSIYDLAVDPESNTVWASTAARIGYGKLSPENQGKTGLLAFDLDSGRVKQRTMLPQGENNQALANLVLMNNGDLLVADALQPVIYRLPAGESGLKRYFSSPRMGSIRGMDRSDDGRLLFIADHNRGMLVLDTEQETPHPLAIPETLNLFGIDGLMVEGNTVIIIQSGFIPQRVMRLELNDAMDEVTRVVALQVNGELLSSPTYGAIGGDSLYYIGNSHWPHLASQTGFGGNQPEPTRILKVGTSAGVDIFSPSLEDLSRAIPGSKQIRIPAQKDADSADEETNQN